MDHTTPRNAAPHHLLFFIWTLLTLLAGCRIARLSVFMLDPDRTELALEPAARTFGDPGLDRPFFAGHNCFTAYLVAGEAAASGAKNIYLRDSGKNGKNPSPIREAIGDRFGIDAYQYPPPFLLLPHALLAGGLDFFQARTFWFALNLLLLIATVTALVTWLGQRGFSPYWFAIPLLLISPTVLTTLQIGNVHLALVCITILALLCFESRHDWLGGILLGFAIVTKLFPALFLLYFLVRRRFSAVLYTAAALAAYCGGTLLLFGPEPFHAFFQYQLPRLFNGGAFSFAWRIPRAILINQSLDGAIYKLRGLGLEWDAAAVARLASWIYSGVLLLAIILVGLRHRHVDVPSRTPTRLQRLRAWLALFILAQLLSPFLPWGYGLTPVLLLLVLLLPEDGRWSGRWIPPLVAFAIFAVTVPLPFGPRDIRFDYGYTLGAFALELILCFGLVLRNAPHEGATSLQVGGTG